MSEEKCKCGLTTEGRGLNYEPECSSCRKNREEAYDIYVDPLGFYRSKSIDNWD